MTNKEILNMYISLVPFLSEVLGKGCEVVVHDLTNPKHSITAIGNPLSGRKIGDSMTNFPFENTDSESYVTNYSGKSKGTNFQSSTYFIKNKGETIGLLCINKEIDCIANVAHLLNDLVAYYNLVPPTESKIEENLNHSVEDIMISRISSAVASAMISPSRMSKEEKMNIVHQLKEDGVLSMRGATDELAKQLEISVPTIYRYIKKTK